MSRSKRWLIGDHVPIESGLPFAETSLAVNENSHQNQRVKAIAAVDCPLRSRLA
jgi:hypothetical protein